MAKALVVVESPAKAKTISRYLDGNVSVIATVGHIKDLPERELGVEVENEFQPRYGVIPGKWKVIKQLRSAAERADSIYLAPDPDREGEAIAWHVAEEVNKDKKLYRVLFHEITRNAVRRAMENPSALDRNKFDAQQARRILDRLVGYQISPILWKKVRRGLSAGRVQSVAVRLVCEREEEIRRFQSQEYWTLDALLEGDHPPSFRARLVRVGEQKPEIPDSAEASRLKALLEGSSFHVLKVEKKRRKKDPPPPFITSTLQQEASRRYRLSPKKTMQIAQKLYEGVSLGEEEPQGLITYMRTDSTRMSQEAVEQAGRFVRERYGAEYALGTPRFYASRKGVQDAHEAIRPTDAHREPSRVRPYLSRDEYRIYELIWKRFIATQMAPAEFDQTTVEIRAGDCLLRATGSVRAADGYLRLYEETTENGEGAEGVDGGRLPELAEGEELKCLEILAEQHFTQPPPRYTESSLIKELEEKGIGRPSTYAAILSNIRDRHYVELQDRRLYPTELGELVNRLLVDHFPDILNVEFTANMENSLDAIESGEKDWVAVLRQFYDAFSASLEKAKSRMADIKRQGTPTEVSCDRCGKPMVIRYSASQAYLACSGYPKCRNAKSFERSENGSIRVLSDGGEGPAEPCPSCGKPLERKYGRFGPFWACTGFPKCRFTRPLEQAKNGTPAPVEFAEDPCPLCGGKLVLKRSRLGNRFWACENYPKCKGARPYRVGVRCDRCGSGEFIERAGRRGGVFYCCSGYPSCRNTLRFRPVARPCGACGAPYLLEKTLPGGGTALFCPNKKCPSHTDKPAARKKAEAGPKRCQAEKF